MGQSRAAGHGEDAATRGEREEEEEDNEDGEGQRGGGGVGGAGPWPWGCSHASRRGRHGSRSRWEGGGRPCAVEKGEERGG